MGHEFGIRLQANSQALIPDPLGWLTCNKSIGVLMDLGSDVDRCGYKPL